MLAKCFVESILALACKIQKSAFVEEVFRSLKKSIERSSLNKVERDAAVNALFFVLRQHGFKKLWSKLVMEETNPGYGKSEEWESEDES